MKENNNLKKPQETQSQESLQNRVLKTAYSLPKNLLCTLIRLYQTLISPLLPQHCRFYPRCSEYSLQALKEYGTLRGITLAFHRIIRCHPWNLGGYDPVTKNPKSKNTCRKESTE